ncbi:MAG: glycosyltransferase family 2 protein [Ignavibacteriaceae bacterium]|nr:glycosyltransferase family 2 protein [Ignavibacteriaceae bacterium]
MKDISVIIVNWNTKTLLRNCLNSVIEQTQKHSYEIWVVDNNSPDKSADMVRDEFPQVKLIANDTNNGFAKANNQALKLSEARYHLLLNPDTIVIENAIDKMVDYMDQTKTHVLTSKLLNDDRTLQKSVSSFFSLSGSFLENRFFSEILKNFNSKGQNLMSYWDHNSIREIDWAHGAVLMMSDEAFRKIGLLDERFYIYAEEMDYYMRFRKAGYKAIYHPEIQIIHYGKSSSRQRRGEMFIMNYKSFYLFLKKHYNSYVYPVYRIRTVIYIHFWLLKFGAEYLFRKITGGNYEEAQVQLKVYSQLLQWHFSGESRISL